MDFSKDPPHGFARVLAVSFLLAPLRVRQELWVATSDMLDKRKVRGRIVTCLKSCRLLVLDQPQFVGAKNNSAAKRLISVGPRRPNCATKLLILLKFLALNACLFAGVATNSPYLKVAANLA